MQIKNPLGLRDDELLLTTEQVAELLQLAVGTLHTYRCRGTRGPRFLKVGGRVRYRLSDIKEYVASGGVSQIGGGR
ncbi:helix-turn-helix transcriptional regulator [Vulgatibacter sp.]|uniref:helix-turn-helix transcriptional regulator n=1 Tax=Vulgatibacter sp. TaxID=1971226 RepID=UPI00356B4372